MSKSSPLTSFAAAALLATAAHAAPDQTDPSNSPAADQGAPPTRSSVDPRSPIVHFRGGGFEIFEGNPWQIDSARLVPPLVNKKGRDVNLTANNFICPPPFAWRQSGGGAPMRIGMQNDQGGVFVATVRFGFSDRATIDVEAVNGTKLSQQYKDNYQSPFRYNFSGTSDLDHNIVVTFSSLNLAESPENADGFKAYLWIAYKIALAGRHTCGAEYQGEQRTIIELDGTSTSSFTAQGNYVTVNVRPNRSDASFWLAFKGWEPSGREFGAQARVGTSTVVSQVYQDGLLVTGENRGNYGFLFGLATRAVNGHLHKKPRGFPYSR